MTGVAAGDRPDAAPKTSAARRSLPMPRPPDPVLAALTPAVLLLLWEILANVGVVDMRFFPPPSRILSAGANLFQSGEMLHHLGASLYRILLGFALGSAIGIAVGLTLGSFHLLRVMFDPVLSGLYVIPKIAILPLIMLIFGLGETSKVVVVALATFFVVAINSLAGVRQIDTVLIEAGRNFGANSWQMFWHVILPGSLPSVFTGLRLGAGTALLVIIAAEFVAASEGIGFLIWQSWSTLVTENMFVGLMLVAALGMLFSWALDRLAAFVAPWRPDELDLGVSTRADV